MDNMTDLPNKPKVPPSVKTRNDTVNQTHDECSIINYHRQAGPSPPQGISSEPYRGTSLTRVDISDKMKRDGGENEQNPMIRYPPPPRQFAATPDYERSSGVVIMDDLEREKLIFAREGAARNNVPEIIVESMSTEGEMEDESQSNRLPFGNTDKPVERVAYPLKPRPASPIPGVGRRPQIPGMPYGVGAVKEKNTLDDVIGPKTPKYSSLLTPHDNHASKMSMVGEIMQTDSHGNKLERTPSTIGRYHPIGSNELSLLRPCEMYTNTEHAAEKDSTVQSTKETDIDKSMASKVFGKLLGKLGSDSVPATPAKKKPVTADGADSNQSGLVSTAGILTSVIRWKAKKKLNTGTRESREKYPGYLDLFNRLSHELMTSVPFPILLQTRREALPIIQNIAKAYKSTLGPHHQMTEQACAKVEKLRSELQDNDVFL